MESSGRINRWCLEKSLIEKSQGSIKPWEIGLLTLSEALMFLEDPKDRDGSGSPLMGSLEIEAELAEWHAMTPLEKLRNYQG